MDQNPFWWSAPVARPATSQRVALAQTAAAPPHPARGKKFEKRPPAEANFQSLVRSHLTRCCFCGSVVRAAECFEGFEQDGGELAVFPRCGFEDGGEKFSLFRLVLFAEGGAVIASEAGAVQELGRRCPDQRIATVDQDATIIESSKQLALRSYEGERGYQPMLAVWAEMDVVLADEFRDGNVPAMMDPLAVARKAFAALPETVTTYYYRGDSACHENRLIHWLRDEKRVEGPAGFIGFAISAKMSDALHTAIGKVPESGWAAYGKEHTAEIRECAEVSFVPGEKSERKDTQPLRYIAIRIRQRQEDLFDDGTKVRHFAVVTNITKWKAGRLIEWHREKAGTIEGVHDVLKNELGAGVMPSKYFGANAAWLRLAAITHNVMTALKRLALPAGMLTARPKRMRFLIFNTAGRLVRHARKMVWRLATKAGRLGEWLEAMRLLPIRA